MLNPFSLSAAQDSQNPDTPPPKFALGLKVTFDFIFYFANFMTLLGVVGMIIIGSSIPSEVSERHTDVHYPLSFKVLPASVLEASDSSTDSSMISEIIQGDGYIKVNNTEGHASFYIAYGLDLLLAVPVLFSLFYLRMLFANFAQRAFFVSQNIDYLRRIGQWVLASSLVYPVLVYLGGMAVLADIGQMSTEVELAPTVSLPFESILIGVALLVLAQVFKEATVIKQEQDLTI